MTTDRQMNKTEAQPSSDDLLATLHVLTSNLLTERIRSGEASAGDISAAIRFLKDNGVTSDIIDRKNQRTPLGELAFTLDESDLQGEERRYA